MVTRLMRRAAMLAAFLCLVGVSARARADAQVLLAADVGTGLRLRDPFLQGSASPNFAELQVAYILGRGDDFSFGPALGIPMGLVGLAQPRLQAGVTPALALYWRPMLRRGPFMDVAVLARLGLPVVATAGASLGQSKLDVSIGGQFGASVLLFVRAGLALHAEIDLSVFFGEGREIFPIASGQVGLCAAFEVFP